MPRLVAPEMIDVAAPPQARMRQRYALLGDLEQIAAADLCLEAEPRNLVAKRLPLLRVPMFCDVPGGIEADIVIEQADPERGQRRQPAPRPTIGAAHFQITLQPHLGENRRQMVSPVRQRRAFARQRVALAFEEGAER